MSHGADPIAVSQFLLEKNWIRERWIFQDNRVSCRITVAGIEEVDSIFIRNKLRRIIGSLVSAGGTKELKEIFENRLEEYAVNLDIVFQLEKLAMVNIVRREGSIFISLTEEGKAFFSRKGKLLYSMMSIA